MPLIKARYNPENKFLITENGKPITYSHFRESIWIPLMEELGMKHTIHETRHTTATKLYDAKVPTLIIKRILGHKAVEQEITTRYTHTSVKQMLKAIDKI